jgi:hypothetical protein
MHKTVIPQIKVPYLYVNVSEKDEIRKLICQALLKHYRLEPGDITVHVSEDFSF